MKNLMFEFWLVSSLQMKLRTLETHRSFYTKTEFVLHKHFLSDFVCLQIASRNEE